MAEGGRVAGQIMGAVSVGTNVGTGLAKLISGDTKGALLSLGQAAADYYAATRACFVAGTMVLVRRGRRVLWMRIEDIRPGDQVWSKPEGNANAPGEWKEVQETFVRVAPILEVAVGGHTIGTTWEHPIYVRQKGWLPAGQVQVGNETLGKDGEWTTVEAVRSTGRVETVYNFRVANYHTYFVGGEDWEFSVWAHNADYASQNGVYTKGSRLQTIKVSAERGKLKAALRAAGLSPGDSVVYVVRDSRTGQYLKVGETRNVFTRFERYQNRARKEGRQIEIDVISMDGRQGRGGSLSRIDLESSTRHSLSEQGHTLPWDRSRPGWPSGKGPLPPGDTIWGVAP